MVFKLHRLFIQGLAGIHFLLIHVWAFVSPLSIDSSSLINTVIPSQLVYRTKLQVPCDDPTLTPVLIPAPRDLVQNNNLHVYQYNVKIKLPGVI